MLKDLRAIVPASEVIPILNHVKITDGKVFAANGEQWAELPWPLVADLPPLCVPYKEAAAFLAVAGDDDVKAKTKDGGFVVFSAGRRRATLPTLPAEDFPELSHVSAGNEVRVDAKSLALVLHCVSEGDRVLSQLGGVCFRDDQILATDRGRIAKQPAHALKEGVLVPLDFCRFVLAHAEDEIVLMVSENAATWRGEEGVVVTTKLLDGLFPKVDHLWKGEPSWRVWAREEFVAALATTGLSTGSDSVKVTVKNGHGHWVSQDPIGKEFVYDGPCAGDDIEFTINRKYLRNAVEARADEPEIRLGLTEPTLPVWFGDDELIMPMRG